MNRGFFVEPGLFRWYTGVMDWLKRPLMCDGVVVEEPLDPTSLADTDMRTICLRMHAIFHTIEMPRAEERWIPLDLFDAIDTLWGMVVHGVPTQPHIADWKAVISEFGMHYDLTGHDGPIVVDPSIYRATVAKHSTESAP